jgi:proline utilization trans-activator
LRCVESFLPFDLESVFISAMILIMSTAIDTTLLEDHEPWSDVAHSILDEMISRGNMVAAFRKKELQKLADLLAQLAPIQTTSRTSEHNRPHDLQGEAVLNANDPNESSNPTDGAFNDGAWPEDLTAEQLTMLADSLNLDGMDWVTLSPEELSARSGAY